MRPISNWNNVQPAQPGDRTKLPADAYVCRIKQAKVEQVQRTDGGFYERLSIAFDIEEGDYAGYFDEQYRSNAYGDRRWKGVFRQTIPADDGSEKDERTKSYFKGIITAIEDSNYGYKFNFDENTLSGKQVGIIFREEEYDYNGHHGMMTKPFIMIDVKKVTTGDFTIPKPKMLSNEQVNAPYSAPAPTFDSNPYTAPAQPQPQNFVPLSTDDDLPF